MITTILAAYFAFGLGYSCAWSFYEASQWPDDAPLKAYLTIFFFWPIVILYVVFWP